MGMVTITFNGSFKLKREYTKTFTAQKGGHVKAIAEAIQWLSECLPEAVNQDHSLHEDRQFPDDHFKISDEIPPEINP